MYYSLKCIIRINDLMSLFWLLYLIIYNLRKPIALSKVINL